MATRAARGACPERPGRRGAPRALPRSRAVGRCDGARVKEELSWGCSGIGTAIVGNTLGAGPVIAAGTDEQKRRWLPPLTEEPLLCAFAITEPNAGPDGAGLQ